ncbi:MAG TPA: SLATT domain-containing protein [Ktedonobacteraceae bacterium]|nr:SLATT domain-containing protein [Ktedonobacteraceae bacterium]
MTSQSKENDEARHILEGQLRECYGRVVYSHKTHEKCTDILLGKLSVIKNWQILLSALTTGGFVSTFLGSGYIGATIGVVLSTILLVLNAYTKNYDLGELAQKHKQAANEIWVIREKYLSLLTDLTIGIQSLENLQKERDKLLLELHAVYVGSPSTTNKAYKKAQDALQRNEDMTFSDEEIDAFLPNELKRTNEGKINP